MKQSWFNIRNEASGQLTIDILDVIGFWGITAKDFLDQVKAAGTFTSIELNVNSPGGDVIEGFTMYDGLRALGVDITANVIGTAASMASVVILAANRVNIAENGQVMIHRVTSGAGGNADELEAAAKITKQFEDRIVSIYVEKTGNDEEQIRDWMKTSQGTWFIGREAIDAGFASAIIKSKKKAAAFKGEWAARFTMLPAALFDTASESMSVPATPETPAEETPIVETPIVETPAPESPAPETPVEPTAPDVEAKGILERIAAAFRGDETIKAELATARAAIASRDAEVAALKAEVQTLKPQAEQLAVIAAKLTEAEAKAKTVGQAAAEIAATHGLKPDALGSLPAPSEETTNVKTMPRDEFMKLPVAEQNAFMRAGGKLE